jgi:hypothetical protein
MVTTKRQRWSLWSICPNISKREEKRRVIFLVAERAMGVLGICFRVRDHTINSLEQYRNPGFQLWSPEGYVVFIPEECVDELKLLDDSIAKSAALKVRIPGINENHH